MSSTPALTVEDVDSAASTDDGQHLLIKLLLSGAQFMTLAVPHDKAMGLLTVISAAGGDAARIRQENQNAKVAFPVEWWEINRAEPPPMIVFSYRIPGGMELSFHVPPEVGERMREALEVSLGQGAPTPPPGKSLN